MKFWHFGILTHDVDETIDFLCAPGGEERGKWKVFDAVFPAEDMVTGEGGKLRIAIGRVGGIFYELIQPLDDTSYHAGQIKARGAGFNHCAYYCEDGFDETVAGLIAAGGRIVWEAKHGDEHPCYIESNGTVLEIINVYPFFPED